MFHSSACLLPASVPLVARTSVARVIPCSLLGRVSPGLSSAGGHSRGGS